MIKTPDKNQQTKTVNGKYVLVWKKLADKWKVVADIDNQTVRKKWFPGERLLLHCAAAKRVLPNRYSEGGRS